MCPPDAVTSGSARKPRAANPARVVAGQAPATTHESGQGNAVRRDITGGRTSPATRGRWHPARSQIRPTSGKECGTGLRPVPHAKCEHIRPARRLTIEATIQL